MKKACLASALALILCQLSPAQGPEMLPGWPYVTRMDNLLSFATPRFSMSAAIENAAVFFNTNLGDIDKFHFDGLNFPGWPMVIDTLKFRFSPVLADLDHDRLLEMITAGEGSWEGDILPFLIVAIDDNGSIMTGFPIAIDWAMFLNVADFDDDGEYEIMTASETDRLIYCFDRYGQLEPGWPVPLPADAYPHVSFAEPVGDLDGDGANELILNGLKNIYAFRFDGSQLPGFPISVWDTTFTFSNNFWPGCLVDLDNDGFLEIAVPGDNYYGGPPGYGDCFVAVYDHTGQIVDGWPLFFQGFVYGGIAPADMNDDGIAELGFYAGFGSDGLRFVDINGELLPGWPILLIDHPGRPRGIDADLILVDVNGDRLPEIFTDYNILYPDSIGQDSSRYYGHSYLFGVDQSGEELPGFPIEVNGWYWRRPPSFAWDDQSRSLQMGLFTDIYTPSYDVDTGYLEIYRFPDTTGPLTEWPMVNHDNLNTRNYNFVDRVISINDEGEEILPKSPILKQNYPNPFNFSTIIEFTLPKRGHVTLSLFDILGRKVADIYNQVMDAGTHRHRLSMKDVSSGIYFYTLKTEKIQITRKMTLVK